MLRNIPRGEVFLETLFEIIPANVFPFLSAILALIVLWQYHEKLVLTGRIQAIDIYDRSGIRMYLYATPDDDQVCGACRDAHGRVFSISTVARKDFTPLRSACSNLQGCTGLLVGLYGAWPEARGVVDRLRAAKKIGSIQVSAVELEAMIKGPWERSVSAATDRFGISMLGALNSERSDPEAAIPQYQTIIEEAKEVRHLSLLVPAYLRLAELLIRQGRTQEAQQTIEQFENRFAPNKGGPHFPTERQRRFMFMIKSRLTSASRKLHAAASSSR